MVDVEGNCGKSRAFVVTGERDRELAYEIMRGLEERTATSERHRPLWPEYEAALAQGTALRRPRRMNHEEAIYRWIAGQSSSGYYEAKEIRGALNIPPTAEVSRWQDGRSHVAPVEASGKIGICYRTVKAAPSVRSSLKVRRTIGSVASCKKTYHPEEAAQ